jgi:cysteine-rich repeat protein
MSVRSNSCESAVRGGESNGTVTGCLGCDYPGSPPRTQAADGHFVTVGFTPLCGNGVIDAEVSEQCDDGNTMSGDCCSSSCQTEVCVTTTVTSSTVTTSTVTTTTTASTTTTVPSCAKDPVAGCKLATPTKSKIGIKDHPDNTKDLFRWRWKGALTTFAELRDPVAAMPQITLCAYDGGGGIVVEAALLPGGTCSGKPCWKTLGPVASPVGYKYSNKLGTPQGIIQARLKAGDADKAQVAIKGKGPNLQSPILGNLPLPLVVQLVVTDDMGTTCWETAFAAPTRNDEEQFKAKGP